MGCNRVLLTATVWLFAYVNVQAQTVYYPAGASQLLKSTAGDMATLLQRSIAGSHFHCEPYETIPADGIVLIYDSAYSNSQHCRVTGNGTSSLRFSAAQDNGLNYGVYEYLHQLGFRFYQPGTIWELIPTLAGPFVAVDTLYSCSFTYKNWFISGGCNTWVMDKNTSYYWDTYYGENGHQWALYQRRNNMAGNYRFAGHRDDIMTSDYLSVLQSNPCYVAPFNESRAASRQSVPDINNEQAKDWWRSNIENSYTRYRNTILGNIGIYKNYYHNFDYANNSIGLEVPDGAHWANSADNSCGKESLVKESDQHFILANYTAGKIRQQYPAMRFQLYAYDGHADVPSAGIQIDPSIDIQVVSTAFQFETSAGGLLNRWYGRSKNISEYHYLNLAQWSGETPAFYLPDLENTVNRLREKKSQGIVWEAAPSKFASLPFLAAANESLKYNTGIDHSLRDFCQSLFGEASSIIYELLRYWSSDETITLGNYLPDNKYKLPFYFGLVQEAAAATAQSSPVIKERINELKAFLHYMLLYYDWSFDQRPVTQKRDKAAALCLYLARINQLQLVNSYFLINDIVNRYDVADEIFTRFNIRNGSDYQDGQLPLLSTEEIIANFDSDINQQSAIIQGYRFLPAETIKGAFDTKGLVIPEKIDVQVGYTNAKDYTARSEFYLLADKPGSFTLKYTPQFAMPGKGYLNFTVEATGKTPGVIKDISIDQTAGQGILYIALPEAGTYKLSIISKYKSSVAISITTNGNYFFRNGGFLGNSIENYRGNLLSLPGYFYVPPGIDRVYFSLDNSNPGGTGFATPEAVSKAFCFKDDQLNAVQPQLASFSDSALFYLQVPAGSAGGFWQAFKMEQYRLCFANISNIQWYARRKPCNEADFSATVVKTNNGCIARLQAAGNGSNLQWLVYDAQNWYSYKNRQSVELPEYISNNAVVTLTTAENCSVTKRLGDEAAFVQARANCASGAAAADPATGVLIYPNPGTGLYRCTQNGQVVLADEIRIYGVAGTSVASFYNTQQFNIGHLPAGIYFYTLFINKVAYKGKLVQR